MTKNFDRRLGKLERRVVPPRIFAVLDTPRNRRLYKRGLIEEAGSQGRRGRAAKKAQRRLSSRDVVVFMSEAEMAL